MNTFEFSTCSSLMCGVDAIQELPDLLKRLAVERALIVTDPGLMTTGIVDRVAALFDASATDVIIYSEVEADPPEAVVLRAAQFAREAKITGVIGLGGGSSLDVAKQVGVASLSR